VKILIYIFLISVLWSGSLMNPKDVHFMGYFSFDFTYRNVKLPLCNETGLAS
jgi:hypothetical protein